MSDFCHKNALALNHFFKFLAMTGFEEGDIWNIFFRWESTELDYSWHKTEGIARTTQG